METDNTTRTSFFRPLCLWRSQLGPLVTIPQILIIAAAIGSPLNILDRSPSLAATVSLARRFLLDVNELADIARYADSTAYPQVALLVCALNWLWLPFSVVLLFLITEVGIARTNWNIWKRTQPTGGMYLLKFAGKMLAGTGVFTLAAIFATMTPGDWSLTNGITTNSRYGLGLLTSGVFFFLAQFVNGIYMALRAFIDLQIRGK